MAGNTPIYGIPYPESSDLVANYPALGEDLAEKLEDKLPTYAATAPTSPNAGQIWIDSDDDKPYFHDGSDWVPFPSGVAAAVFSNTPTGNYTDGNGVNWDYFTFNSSGTLTCTTAGSADILVVSGGGGGGTTGAFIAGAGGGGAAYFTSTILEAIAYTVTIGAGGAIDATGGFSGFKPASGFGGVRLSFQGGGAGGPSSQVGRAGSSGGGGSNNTGGAAVLAKAYGGDGTNYASGGAGGDATANNAGGQGAGISSDITGTAVTYGKGNFFTGETVTANIGRGGQPNSAGGSGVVIIRTRT